MDFVDVNGVTFRVEERGRGDPLVLLHGFTGAIESWSSIRDDLARDRRVIAIDLIGHGESGAPDDPRRYAFHKALDNLAAIVEKWGFQHASWVGYSMGGRLALGLALRFPHLVSSLILESATAGIADAQERATRRMRDATLAQQIESGGIERFVEAWERLPMWESQRLLPAVVLDRQRQVRLRNRAIGLANSLRGMGQGSQPSMWHRLDQLRVSTLLIVGEYDRKFYEIGELMRSRIAAASLLVVPAAGHAVHLERPELYVGAIRAFLSLHNEGEERGGRNGEEVEEFEEFEESEESGSKNILVEKGFFTRSG